MVTKEIMAGRVIVIILDLYRRIKVQVRPRLIPFLQQ